MFGSFRGRRTSFSRDFDRGFRQWLLLASPDQGCRYAYSPKSRSEFWEAKFEQNVIRDRRNLAALEIQGWRVAVMWECEVDDAHLKNLAKGILLPIDQAR